MMKCLLLLLVLLCVFLALRLLFLKRSISRANEELREISKDLKENRVVKLSVPEKELEEFLASVNQNLTEIRSERLAYEKKEQDLKEQVENISHDLRTPLTAVLGYLKMIDKDSLGSEEREYLETAIRKAHGLGTLVSQFYDLSRITSGDFHLKPDNVDAGRLLREYCLDQYLLFERAGLELCVNIPERPVMVRADREALERIFGNLLQNGIRYARSRLTVALVLPAKESGVKILFENDVEPGREVSDPSRLFDRFYMQEESRTRGGTGLGLTISKYLAELMNIRMEAGYAGSQGQRVLDITLEFGREPRGGS